MRNKQSRHLRIVHSDSEAIAGGAGLSHLKDGGADPVSIPNADLIVGETVNSEIFSELSVLEVISAEFALPIPVSFKLINHNGAVLTAVALKVGLAISVQIEPSSKDTPWDRVFPDRRADSFPLPCDFTWKADINGQKFRHRLLRAGGVFTGALFAADHGQAPAIPGHPSRPVNRASSLLQHAAEDAAAAALDADSK